MKKYRLCPVSLNLENKACLVIGGGNIAEKRVRAVLDCGAQVRVISPQVTPVLARLSQRGSIVWIRDIFREAHLGSPDVICGATDDPSANAWIYNLAKKRHCLVNLADDPRHCDFHFPAVVRRGHLAVAVSTDGQSPAFAAWLAKLLDDLLDRYLGRVLARYAQLRPKMKALYPRMTDRAQAWQRMLDEEGPRVLAVSSKQ
ncbi:MAG TPA: bifunctional precorrin-2 dehydrogenase/sirohydrochlorin ferrochelatase [Acidobacteriota bacterium]|nr:bifunctional precorrin-2 dehydrogenase/sirohydrochlorin ferrochelatase [Acidobacteriota bacterium]